MTMPQSFLQRLSILTMYRLRLHDSLNLIVHNPYTEFVIANLFVSPNFHRCQSDLVIHPLKCLAFARLSPLLTLFCLHHNLLPVALEQQLLLSPQHIGTNRFLICPLFSQLILAVSSRCLAISSRCRASFCCLFSRWLANSV